MRQHTTRQHFVPRFYLSNFTNRDGFVYVWDKCKQKLFKTTVDNICYEKDLYDIRWQNADPRLGKYVLDNKIENEFADKEGVAASVIKKVVQKSFDVNNIFLDNDERRALIEFIALLYLRNPDTIKRIINFINTHNSHGEMVETIDSFNQVFSELGLGEATSLIDYSKMLAIFSSEIAGSPFNKELEKMQKMTVVFWRAVNDLFVAGSFPLIINAEKNYNFVRIVLPISPNVACVLFDKRLTHFVEGDVFNIKSDVVSEIYEGFYKKYDKDLCRFIISNNKKTIKRIIG